MAASRNNGQMFPGLRSVRPLLVHQKRSHRVDCDPSVQIVAPASSIPRKFLSDIAIELHG